jgi:hypothetical protein
MISPENQLLITLHKLLHPPVNAINDHAFDTSTIVNERHRGGLTKRINTPPRSGDNP